MILKKSLLAFLYFFLLTNIFAQVSVNPGNDFYSEAIAWDIKGYLSPLPLLKPYPIKTVERILNEVIQNGEEEDVALANFYLEKYCLKKRVHGAIESLENIHFQQNEHLNSSSDEQKYHGFSVFSERLSSFADFSPHKNISVGFDVSAVMRTNHDSVLDSVVPYSDVEDYNVVDVMSINTDNLDFLLDLNAVAAFGLENLYFTVGHNKIGDGFFFSDSIILNHNAYQTINYNFNYAGKYFSYSQFLGLLGAQGYSNHNDYAFGKLLAFHSLKIPLFHNKFSFSFFESVVFGKIFNPIYLTPLPYFIVANVSGNSENVFSGLQLDFRPFDFISVSGGAFLDDFKPKKLIKLKVNESGVRVGFKSGLVYSPKKSFCDFVEVEYTLITPYTYTKTNSIDDDYNFRDYTNFGTNIGSCLPQNSDRISMKIAFRPFPQLKFSTISTLIRHANPYEDLECDEVVQLSKMKNKKSDGSIYTDAKDFDTSDKTSFLKQDTIMYTIQIGFDIEYEFFVSKAGRFNFMFQYIFEHTKNNGVDSDIWNSSYANLTKWECQELYKSDLDAWKDKLHDSYSHYFTVGVKYTY